MNTPTSAVEQAPSRLIETAHDKDTGGRRLEGIWGQSIYGVAVAWSAFQLWVASPLPYALGIGLFNETAVRTVHLAFALLLAFTLYTMRSRSVRHRVPAMDWLLAIAGIACALYPFLFQAQLITRPGAPTAVDIAVACLGIVVLAEATRRVLGWPMTIIGLVFLVYVFLGPWMPSLIAHKGASLSRVASHFWLTTEGVFGVALGVSASFVFLYVLFGAMLDRAGAGEYLTAVAFSLLGNFRGGPAKAAILSSGLNGMVSGSSVANVLTGGNVTISLMKRVGYSPVKAGAIEVASSSNGQLMPPVMGAAAFLMVEYVNVPYTDIIRHALVPALLAYASLLYIAHLEAMKAQMVGLPRAASPLRAKLMGWGITLASLAILINVAMWLTTAIPAVFGEAATLVAATLVVGGYVALMFLSSKHPTPALDGPAALTVLPPVGPTVLSGLHFLLPLFLLVWCLTVLEQSPGLAAFYACLLMAVMLVTRRPLTNLFRGERQARAWVAGWLDFVGSLADGGKNMVGIAVATAAAGLVVGAVSLTGVGQVLSEVVEVIAGNSILGILLLTTLFCLVLGMGLPTTANYIVVSTLLAPVIVALAASNGLEVPLVAVHLFVFYFGIMADATPPVCLAAYAAAGLSGADPLKTGVQAFVYEMRTAILPFVWIFNTELLLIGQDYLSMALTIGCAALACMAFASATQGWFIVRCRWWEVLGLLIVAFILMWPQALRDQLVSPWRVLPASQLEKALEGTAPGQQLRVRIAVTDRDDKTTAEKTYLLPVLEGDVAARLKHIGITLENRGSDVYVGLVEPGSPAEKVLLNDLNDNRVLGIEVRNPDLPPKAWFVLPAILMLGLIATLQLQRRRRC